MGVRSQDPRALIGGGGGGRDPKINMEDTTNSTRTQVDHSCQSAHQTPGTNTGLSQKGWGTSVG